MKMSWWKIAGVILVSYTIIMGFLGEVPKLAILHETIRNLYFHVTMWFAMIALLIVSLVYSIKHLLSDNMSAVQAGNTLDSNNWSNLLLKNDNIAAEAAHVGMFLGLMGLFTGMLWAQFTWGSFWVNDPKLNGTAVTLLVYTAYFILRGSFNDENKSARISAVYNIFAFVLMIVFIGILPRMTDSLHPGNGGNPAFSQYDLDSNMRLVFYPAVIGWTLIGVWMLSLRVRIKKLENKAQ
jgi:heme exporter protein C